MMVSFLAGASAQEEDGKPKGRYEAFLFEEVDRLAEEIFATAPA